MLIISGTTWTVSPVQCAYNEDHATLNYADSLQGTSELVMWLLLPDGTTPDIDVTTAFQGSGKWLPLPATGSDDKPIRLLIRRALTASSWDMKFMSVSLSVLYARRVEVEVIDSDGHVNAQHQVRTLCSSTTSSCSSSTVVVVVVSACIVLSYT